VTPRCPLSEENEDMFAFLLIVQTLIAVALIGTILMQRSEGGGLGVGGSSSGFMTARGAADFLTRSTAVLGGLFIVLSIVMAAIAGASRQPAKIDTSLANTAAPLEQPKSAPPAQQQPNPAPAANPQQNQAPAVPLAQ
jgi:preprotein translocase subunit SecG